jgi:hypothetical protein
VNSNHLVTPTNIQITDTHSGLVIRVPWFYSRYGIAFVMVIVLSLFAYFQFEVELNNPDAWPFFLVMIPAYIWLFYFFLTKFFNYTEIAIGKSGINVRHKPLPFRKGSFVDWKNASEIVVDEKYYQGRTKREYYEVSVIKNSARCPVVTYLERFEQAKQIQSELRMFFDNMSRETSTG